MIVPVYRNAEGLALCLEALSRQTYPSDHIEVIAVQDEPADAAIQAVCRRFPEVRYLQQPNGGSYSARNRGISHAKGSVLAFTDSDCVPTESWIEQGVAALASRDRPSIAGGYIEMFFADPERPNAFELYDSLTFLQQERMIQQRQAAATANVFAARAVFDAVGSFDASVRSGGDGEWGRRASQAGYEVHFAPSAVVRHPARATLRESFRKWVRVLRGFHELAGKSGYIWAGGRGVMAQLFAPRLGIKLERVFASPRARGRLMKYKVAGLTLLHYYTCELARLRYTKA